MADAGMDSDVDSRDDGMAMVYLQPRVGVDDEAYRVSYLLEFDFSDPALIEVLRNYKKDIENMLEKTSSWPRKRCHSSIICSDTNDFLNSCIALLSDLNMLRLFVVNALEAGGSDFDIRWFAKKVHMCVCHFVELKQKAEDLMLTPRTDFSRPL